MRNNDRSLIEQAKAIIGDLTPLRGHDCGQLCSAACCKEAEGVGEEAGMLLFPGEETTLRVINLPDGSRLAVCDGSCERSKRPLACMLFPFFPTVDEKGRVYAEIDARACGVCPLAAHSEEVIFDRAFVRAVKKAGRLLSKDKACLEFMRSITGQIDQLDEIRRAIL